MWYDYNEVMSHNAMLNFIIGERGVGKSYGIKKYVINKAINKKRKFIYLRRYETELKKSINDNEFFKDIGKDNKFKDYEFKIDGDKFLYRIKGDKNKWIVIGYAIPLSKALIYKSVPFDDVDTIIFDEFLIDTGTYKYLKNEPEKLLDFMETVGRLRDNVHVYCLGNSISIVNPYFDYFNLSLPYNKTIKKFQEGLILVNYIKNIQYREIKKQTNFGKLIKGTKYAEYNINNNFLKDNNNFIKKRSKRCRYFYTIKIDKHLYGVWVDNNTNEMFINNKVIENYGIVLALNTNDHNENTMLIKTKSVFFQNLYNHYKIGLLFFESQTIKSNILEIIRKINRY